VSRRPRPPGPGGISMGSRSPQASRVTLSAPSCPCHPGWSDLPSGQFRPGPGAVRPCPPHCGCGVSGVCPSRKGTKRGQIKTLNGRVAGNLRASESGKKHSMHPPRLEKLSVLWTADALSVHGGTRRRRRSRRQEYNCIETEHRVAMCRAKSKRPVFSRACLRSAAR